MSKNSVELTVLNPRGMVEAKSAFAPNPRVKDLAGKRVGLYSNGKPGMDNFYTVFEAKFEGYRIKDRGGKNHKGQVINEGTPNFVNNTDKKHNQVGVDG